MSMDIETLKRIGTDVDGSVRRTGSGKKQGTGKMPRAEKCEMHGSKYCINTCRGHSQCKKNIHVIKELTGYTLIQSWHGIATQHPEWVGRWKKL